jgi:hypothetical protein
MLWFGLFCFVFFGIHKPILDFVLIMDTREPRAILRIDGPRGGQERSSRVKGKPHDEFTVLNKRGPIRGGD